MGSLALLAVENAPPDPLNGWASYGVLGLLVLALLIGYLVPGYIYKRVEEENSRLRELVDTKVYPLIETATATQRESMKVMKDMADALARYEHDERSRRR